MRRTRRSAPSASLELLRSAFIANPEDRQTISVYADAVLESGVPWGEDFLIAMNDFDPTLVKVAPIRDDQEYGGVRVTFVARLASAKVPLQVDVGFGDAVTPGAQEIEFPALLDFPSPRLRAYPRETVAAEKIEAFVKLGLANTRM